MTERTDTHSRAETMKPAYLAWAVLGYGHPDDVVSDAELTADEKRMILASWLSDRRAVENEPTMRQIDSGAIVLVHDIMEALRRLDESPAKPGSFDGLPTIAGRRLRRTPSRHWRSRAPDDDDDPPPCAAAALPPRAPRDDPDAAAILIPSAMAA